jgi:membrane protein DedA with SNARE-associated domain
MHYQDVLIEVIRLFYAHYFIIAFAGGLLGEEVLLFLAFLSVHMKLSIWVVLPFGFLGILAFDSIWFALNRTRFAGWIKEKIPWLSGGVIVERIIDRFGGKYRITTMILSKFIFSVRIPLIMYLSNTKMKYKSFIIRDILAVGVWAVIMIPLVMLAGRGFVGGMQAAENLGRIIGIAILFIAVLYLINRVIFDELLMKGFKSIKEKMF